MEETLIADQIMFAVLLIGIISQLPKKTLDLLAQGPIGDDEGVRGCRLCDTIAETIDHDNLKQVAFANILLDYHDIDGSEGPECYRRCCQIYLAAGWNGLLKTTSGEDKA